MQDGTQKSQKVFMNIPTEVGATEAEAIGKQSLPAARGLLSLAALSLALLSLNCAIKISLKVLSGAVYAIARLPEQTEAFEASVWLSQSTTGESGGVASAYPHDNAVTSGLSHTGVEHLLRDVKDATVSTLAADVSTLATGLNGLRSRLLQIQEYLALVLDGKLPVNHDIMYQLQVAFF